MCWHIEWRSMDSEKTDPAFLRRLFSPGIALGVWIPIVLVSIFHYATSHELHHIHDVLRRIYYLPIVVGAISLGIRGGLMTAGVVTLAYLPHAFFLMHHFDPARESEKILEVLLYFIVGTVAGYLSGKEKKHRSKMEQSLQQQHQLSEQLIRAGRLSALGETVAGIAHEVKNPLHSMAGTVEIIDPLIPKDAKERRMWEIHKAEITRLGRVADRFLSFARPSDAAMQNIDLRDVAHRVMELAKTQAGQKGISVVANISDAPVPVLGDTDQLSQIGMNIVLNAIKAIDDDGGTIQITVAETKRDGTIRATLAIENNGPEILEKQLESIFDPFHSGTDSTGLGMSISSRIAAAHQGFISAENKGLGVTFTLWLPLIGH